MQRSYEHADIANRLKACAGQIISKALTVEHVPEGARDLMRYPFVHEFVRVAFRDVVVECLAAYFDRLEESRKEVLEEVVNKTKSKYGMRLRLVESALQRKNRRIEDNLFSELEHCVTPELYTALVAVVKEEYARP